MASSKSGPIKPPIIDLSANKAKDKNINKPKTPGAEKEAKPSLDGLKKFSVSQPLLMVFCSIGGAILGVAIAFLLALAGFWPQNNAPITPISQMAEQNSTQIKNLTQQINDFENIKADLNKQIIELSSQNDNVIKRINNVDEQISQQEGVQQQIADIIANIKVDLAKISQPASQPDFADIDEINNKFKLLDERLAALSLASSNGQGEDYSALFVPVKQDMLKLIDEIKTINNNVNSQAGQINILEKNLDALTQKLIKFETANIASPANISQQANVQLPLIISNFESAIYNGQSFLKVLDELKIILPDVAVEKSINKLAIDGLADPQAIIDEFSANVPDILLAKPKIEGAGWRENLLEKAKSMIALRPTKVTSGTSPSELVAQIENALEKRDFRKANDLINSLPPLMQEAVGKVGKKISSFANVQIFIQNIRDQALNNNESIN